MTAPAPAAERVVPVACSYNCGGRCVLRAHVRDGRVVRVSTDETPDLEDNPQLRACLKGRSSHLRINHPDRLLYPLKRTGPRGSGAFQRISWDEATSLLAENLRRILDVYGPQKRVPCTPPGTREPCPGATAPGAS